MPAIPSFVLKKLYVKGSLRAEAGGFALDIKNSVAPATLLGVGTIALDGAPVSAENVRVVLEDGSTRVAASVAAAAPISFPLGATFSIVVEGVALEPGAHRLQIGVVVQDVGPLEIPVADTLG
ncbi:MAG: hypothetical protein JXD18_00910 [Anaerolineae bacterium]|nr:hypothetical protein [Anaerolineae bacterium]